MRKKQRWILHAISISSRFNNQISFRLFCLAYARRVSQWAKRFLCRSKMWYRRIDERIYPFRCTVRTKTLISDSYSLCWRINYLFENATNGLGPIHQNYKLQSYRQCGRFSFDFLLCWMPIATSIFTEWIRIHTKKCAHTSTSHPIAFAR